MLDIKVTREVLTVSDQMHGLEEEHVNNAVGSLASKQCRKTSEEGF